MHELGSIKDAEAKQCIRAYDSLTGREQATAQHAEAAEAHANHSEPCISGKSKPADNTYVFATGEQRHDLLLQLRGAGAANTVVNGGYT